MSPNGVVMHAWFVATHMLITSPDPVRTKHRDEILIGGVGCEFQR